MTNHLASLHMNLSPEGWSGAPLTRNRTAYDAKNRAKYGVPTSPTGDSADEAPLGLMLKFW